MMASKNYDYLTNISDQVDRKLRELQSKSLNDGMHKIIESAYDEIYIIEEHSNAKIRISASEHLADILDKIPDNHILPYEKECLITDIHQSIKDQLYFNNILEDNNSYDF